MSGPGGRPWRTASQQPGTERWPRLAAVLVPHSLWPGGARVRSGLLSTDGPLLHARMQGSLGFPQDPSHWPCPLPRPPALPQLGELGDGSCNSCLSPHIGVIPATPFPKPRAGNPCGPLLSGLVESGKMAGPEPLARPAPTGFTGGSILPRPTSGPPETMTQPREAGAGNETHASPRPPPLMTKTGARLRQGAMLAPRGRGRKALWVGRLIKGLAFPWVRATPKISSFQKIALRRWCLLRRRQACPVGESGGGEPWGRGRAGGGEAGGEEQLSSGRLQRERDLWGVSAAKE